MAVRTTVTLFPTDLDAQEAGGLPWGVTVTPFSQINELDTPPAYGSEVVLGLLFCGTVNGLTPETIRQYSDGKCPEMISSFIDVELPAKVKNQLSTYCLFRQRRRQPHPRATWKWKIILSKVIWGTSCKSIALSAKLRPTMYNNHNGNYIHNIVRKEI